MCSNTFVTYTKLNALLVYLHAKYVDINVFVTSFLAMTVYPTITNKNSDILKCADGPSSKAQGDMSYFALLWNVWKKNMKSYTTLVLRTTEVMAQTAFKACIFIKIPKLINFIITEILQRFCNKFCRKAEIFAETGTRGLYVPVSIWVSSEVSDSIGTETVSRQLLLHQTHKVNLRQGVDGVPLTEIYNSRQILQITLTDTASRVSWSISAHTFSQPLWPQPWPYMTISWTFN